MDNKEDDWRDRKDVDCSARKWSDSGFILKEDSTGFAEGLDKSIGEKDEFLFGGMSR